MILQTRLRTLLVAMVAGATLSVSVTALAADDDGVEFKKLMKKNDCFKCHAFDKTKKGPSYKKIAGKYKGKEAEGETKMYKNLTTGPKVKLEDGTEEEHKKIEASEAETKALIKWLLAQ